MKRLYLTFAIALLMAEFAKPALAQEWPQQTIRIVVSFGPGGGADIIGRILAESMQAKLGKAVIIENKPGAGGILGNDVVAKATPDGYTLGIMTAGQIIAAVTKKNMPYDTSTAFAPVGQIATAGFGATQHFAGEMFKQIAGVNLLHVPYKTSPEAINAVLGKNADILFDTVSALLGQVKSGQLKALAVTGKDRFPAVPDVPPAADSGVLPGFDVTTWYGVFAPRGTPPAVIARLNKTLNESLADEAVTKRMALFGVVVKSSTPDEFGIFLANEFKRWNAVRETAGIPQQ